jgi:serine/threonine protein phosphatase PrpC
MVVSDLRRWFTSRAGVVPQGPVFDLEFAFTSDPGCVRAVNEDCACCLQPPRDPKGLLAVVADGMGGHTGGAEASSLAVRVVGEKYYDGPADPQVALTQAFHAANRAIYKKSVEPGKRGMGTTCTALAVVGANAYCAHVGDSRLYMIRDGEIHQLTEDHSKAMELARQGVITAEEARQHAQRNVIFRALGRDTDLAVSSWSDPLRLRANDRFVLSSDGLHDLVTDEEIRATVLRTDSRRACDELAEQARAAGGHDNITVMVGRIGQAAEGGRPGPGFGAKRG